jgi:pimeloyl-ACP methyl ester carboxylesterase
LRIRTLASVLAAGVLVAAALLAAAPALERGGLALLILLDIQAGAGRSALKERSAAPQRRAADFTIDGRQHSADGYLPAEGEPRATLVLLHGLAPEGRREPRLVDFATTLARAGFAVLVPELPGMRSLSAGREDVRDIGDALRHALDAQDDCRPVGELAVSFAVGPALIAALAPGVRERLAFVVAVGGYYDLAAAITYATTGFDPLSGRRGPPPAPEGRWWLLLSQAAQLPDPGDRKLLRELARRRLGDPAAAVDELAAQLGPGGRALYALIANTDPQRVQTLLAVLPEPIRDELAVLDLAARNLESLGARLLLIHGTGDAVLPISHSRALHQRLGPDRAPLFEADGLQHVDVAPGLADAWQLWRALYALLELTERHAPACQRAAEQRR